MEYGDVTPLDRTPRPRFQFSLRFVLSLPVLVVFPVAMAYLFDSPITGVWTALIEIAAGIIYRPTREITVVILLLLLLVALLLPARSNARAAARASQCRNNLKQIILALELYHDRYSSFPPAYVADESGRPMHSWRVLLLPYLENTALYQQYDFNEPWDGPNNSKLAGQIVCSMMNCPSDRKHNTNHTNYVLVTGKETAWVGDKAPRFGDFHDGYSRSIAVVEIANSGIHWMEPRDLTFHQALRGINSPLGMSISARHPARGQRDRPDGAHVALVDGTILFLKNDTPLADLKAMLTPNGGESFEP
jgi:type II secretory pathway pseudopilin PulG